MKGTSISGGRLRAAALALIGLAVMLALVVLWKRVQPEDHVSAEVERDPGRRVPRAALRLSAGPSEDGAPDLAWLVEPGAHGRIIAGQVLSRGKPLEGVRASANALAGGNQPRGGLGARLSPISRNGLDASAFVDVIPSGPAERAGVLAGDVLVSVAGASALGEASKAAAHYMQTRGPGEAIEITG